MFAHRPALADLYPPMHPKNRYQAPHDFPALAKVVPQLNDHLVPAPDGHLTLDFTHPDAVRYLNKALLLRDYGLKHWDIPAGNLCPGVPGRLDYIHAIHDLLAGDGAQVPAKGKKAASVTGLDVGTGASLIYPILGVGEYGWNFVATDIDDKSLKVAGAIAKFNPTLKGKIQLRQQKDKTSIFEGIIRPEEQLSFTMCNPPFFADAEGAERAAKQKWEKLGQAADTGHNFGGQANELWTPGGEPAFLRRMILESRSFGKQVGWFTTLVSKKGYLRAGKDRLAQVGAKRVKVISIGQGGKVRRVLAWRFS